MCKDSNGEWTKWVKERLQAEHLTELELLYTMVREDPQCEELSLMRLSENELIRYLAGNDWKAKDALDMIKRADAFMLEWGLWEVQDKSEY